MPKCAVLQGSQPDKYGLRPISDMDVSTWEVNFCCHILHLLLVLFALKLHIL